ncbi:MAG TPA: type II CAAX endopeptidase family protein [Actinomycetota bacterium]|nr:type II CAAX endopeptidase family protein [Actinomycetota bacterium]
MSDRVPPRPDLPAHGASIPEMPAPERPLATWRWWEALLVYLLIMVVSAFAALPIFEVIRSRGLANLSASAIIALLNVALLVLWLQRFHPRWRDVIGLPRRIWPEVRAGTGFGALLYPVVFVVGVALNLLLELVTGQSIRAPRQLPAHLSTVGVAVSIAYSLVIAPIHEELFFRGILFRSLADRYGFAVGFWGSGLAFGLIHYVPAPSWYGSVLLMGIMVFTGVALAWFYQRRGNIVASMVAHATFNVIGLTLILALR